MRVVAPAIALIAMAQPAMAATYLCVEEVSTGFNWSNGHWTQTNFVNEQHIVQRLAVDNEMARGCYAQMEKVGRSTERIVDSLSPVLADQWACYSQINVGDTATYMDVSPCKELYFKDGLNTVACNDAIYSNYRFEPAGEFVITLTSSAPLTVDNPAQPRDSLALSVGKCSVIAP